MKIELELNTQQVKDLFNQIFTSTLDGTPKAVVSIPTIHKHYHKKQKISPGFVSVPYRSITPLIRRYVETNVAVGKTFTRRNIQGYVHKCLKKKVSPWSISDAIHHEIHRIRTISRAGRGLYTREK